jgi:hypothetical protein
LTTEAHPLAGTWALQRWEIAYDDGRPTTCPFGAAATGLIMYTTDGWMSACIARAGRPPLSSESVRSAPAEQQIAAFGSYFQYAGRYALRPGPAPGARQVVHSVTHSLNPNFVGTEQVRDMRFDGPGRLTLSAADHVPGTQVLRQHRLIWQRVA